MAQQTKGRKGSREHSVSPAFRWFHAASANGTAMLISAVISSYYAVFMTDTMRIPAAACSVIMLVTTLWDAANNLIMGVVADRTHTRWGRYRVYFIPAPVLLTLFATLLWLNPGLPQAGRIIWVLVCYIGYFTTVTMYTMPQTAILPACVKDNQERNSIITLGAGFCAAMFTVGSTFTPQITAAFERFLHVSNGYVPFMAVCGFLSFLPFWGLFATSRETYIQQPTGRKLSQDLKAVLKHTELIPYIVVWIMACMGYGLMFSSSVYYMMYYIGRPDLISVYMGVVSVGALISMVVLMPIVLKVFRTGPRALRFSAIGSILCYGVLFVFGKYHLLFLYILSFAATAIASMQNALVNVLVYDMIDYIQLKEGFSANGVISSLKGFAQKCGNTVVSSGILAVLAASGYIAGAVGQQPQSAMYAVNFLRFGAPALTSLVLVVCLLFNPVERYRDEIEEMKRRMEQNG